MDKEKHRQQVEMLREQNRISEDRIRYLRDMERKLKQVVFDWRKAESQDDKRELMKQLHTLLFAQKQQQVTEKKKKKLNARWIEVGGEGKAGDLALMLQNNQVGTIREVRGKKAIIQLGLIQITVDVADLVVVREREEGSGMGLIP